MSHILLEQVSRRFQLALVLIGVLVSGSGSLAIALSECASAEPSGAGVSLTVAAKASWGGVSSYGFKLLGQSGGGFGPAAFFFFRVELLERADFGAIAVNSLQQRLAQNFPGDNTQGSTKRQSTKTE